MLLLYYLLICTTFFAQYAETLSKYHGFMVKKTFDMGLMAAPSTDTMLPCLGSDKVGFFSVQPCLLVCTLHSSHVRIPLHVVKTFDLGLMAA